MDLRFTVYCFVLIVGCDLLLIRIADTKPCSGTSRGVSYSHNSSEIGYQKKFQNCTQIFGNLEIVFLDRPYGMENETHKYNLSFLSTIREVTGYVLILGVYASEIPLTNLRIIRGETLFKVHGDDRSYSLYVSNNYQEGVNGTGLRELQLTSLHEIPKGDVIFHNNRELCYEETKSINWTDILSNKESQAFYEDNHPRRNCPSCHPNCTTRFCWGEGPDMCQKLNRKCAAQCDSTCYGPLPSDCCHAQCLGGCSGPRNTDCWACKHVNNSGKCERICPELEIYSQGRRIPNPDGKYQYGTICVDECPSNLLVDQHVCVSSCGVGKYEAEDGRNCVRCPGGLCPKVCEALDAYVHQDNIANYTNCTTITGILNILQSSLEDISQKTKPVSVEDLSVFESVEKLGGSLVVQANHPDFTSLRFFKNLRVIQGRELSVKASVLIKGTSLKSLDLRSLRAVQHGKIVMIGNEDLCYVDTINWFHITNSTAVLRRNKSDTECGPCSDQCTSDGCWGPGAHNCLKCINFYDEDSKLCVDNCELLDARYADTTTRTCLPCDAECQNSCTGPGANECDSCRNVRDGDYCLEKCPSDAYNDNGICRPCSPNCVGGCTGPDNNVGPGACNDCGVLVYEERRGPIDRCLDSDSECEDGYYSRNNRRNLTGTPTRYLECYPCHPLCTICDGEDPVDCSGCKYYKQFESANHIRCVQDCSENFYLDEANKECRKCHDMCVLCYGPADDNCYVCRDFKLYSELSDDPEEIDNTKFTCVDVCPEYAPKHALDESHNGTSTICATEALYDAMNKESNKGKMVGGIVGGIIAGVVIIGIIAVIVYYLQFERAKSQEATARIEAKLTGLDEIQPLAPTADKPDMTKLKIITESELQKYDVIGSGAFGTVYKGLWIPPDENVKVLVAIKVLREGSSADQNAELLEEARIMASVIHPNCTRIFAVCMTAQMMIVMPFVANGSLLDYIRRNQSNIGSKNLLNWAVQIARGMEYLQKRGIVHRDLAARNVLVHSENLVKITDFGLAKLLDKDQDKFKAAGGKMPIKWLALESIHHRIFTHQSDVWSYGVTLWELFTYGKRPYDNIHAYDIPEFLEKGQRLSQPSICTIDVYMIMIKCWMVDASNRPSFNYLAEEFAKMARDPGRYLMIQGDELLKLPEDQQYDAQELLAHETSDSAEIVTADDYLMPKTYDRDIDEKPEMEGSPYKKRKSSRKSANDAADSKFGGLAGKKGRPNDHHSSSRYISDPTGKGPKEDEQVAPASVGNDDYLEPTANAPAYMDIVDDRIGNTENKGASAENPEYFRNDKMTPKSNPSDYYNVGKPKVQSADSMKRSLLNESSV